MKKRKTKKNGHVAVGCSERDRLWKDFLNVGEDWESIKAEMRKALKQGDAPNPDLAKIEDLQTRIKTTHELFARHVAKHGCQQPKGSERKGKHSK